MKKKKLSNTHACFYTNFFVAKLASNNYARTYIIYWGNSIRSAGEKIHRKTCQARGSRLLHLPQKNTQKKKRNWGGKSQRRELMNIKGSCV